MGRLITISIPEEVKSRLEKIKGDREWGDFLLCLMETAEEAKRQRSYKKLRELLTDEDIENIRDSSKRFRKEFII